MSNLYASAEIPGIANTGIIIAEDGLDNPDVPPSLREVLVTIKPRVGRVTSIRLNQESADALRFALQHIFMRVPEQG